MDAIAEEKTSTTASARDDAKGLNQFLPPPVPPHLLNEAKNDEAKNGTREDDKGAFKDSSGHNNVNARKESKPASTPTTPYTDDDDSEDYGEIEPSILFDYNRSGLGKDISTPLSLPKHSNRGDDDRSSVLSPPTHDLQDRDVVGRYVEVMDDGGVTPMKHIPLPIEDNPDADDTRMMNDTETSDDYGSIQPSILFDPVSLSRSLLRSPGTIRWLMFVYDM